MKAADITDEAFVAAMQRVAGANSGWAMLWDLTDALGMPEKVVRAKARKLIKRGVIDGCACGCRGDFRLPATVAAIR